MEQKDPLKEQETIPALGVESGIENPEVSTKARVAGKATGKAMRKLFK